MKDYKGVVIKQHPRDRKNYICPDNFTVIKEYRPFERIYYGFNGVFISNLSACLHTAKFMQPNSTVICTVFMDENKDKKQYGGYIKMLKDQGVLFPKTLQELKKMISQNINKI